MNNRFSVGIDVAKRAVRYHVTDDKQCCINRGAIPANGQGLERLAQALASIAPAAQLPVLLEATGLLHIHWAERLMQRGYPVLVVNPLVAKRLFSAANALRDNKTDRLDAADLAVGGYKEEVVLEKFRYRSDPRRFGLQRLSSVRAQVRQMLTNARKAYGSLLTVVFPELDSLVKIHSQAVRSLLAESPTPLALAQQSLAKLRRAFGSHAVAVRDVARSSLADPVLAAASAPALQAQLRLIASLEEQLTVLEKQCQDHAARIVTAAETALVRSLPGLGAKTSTEVAAWVPAEFWKPQRSRRRTAERLLAFMGAEPRVKDSGKLKGQRRMSKRGCAPLRTAMFQASFCGMRYDQELATLYAGHRAKGKPHKVAISHLMRRQVQRLVTVMQTRTPMSWRPKTSNSRKM